MNNIMITNAVVIEYSKEEPVGYVKRQNQFGSYICFRILEKIYNNKPMLWLCVGNDEIITRIEKMKLKPRDQITVAGKVQTYMDEERNREAFQVVISSIEYNFCGMREKKPETPMKTEEEIKQDIEIIDLSKCDIFQQTV